jgi:hypothetical protein
MSNLRVPVLAAAAAAMSVLVACSKKDDAGAPASVPPLSQRESAPAIPPPPPVPAPPPALPPPPPPPAAPDGAAPSAAAGGSITGKIELASALAKKKPEGTLFLVARLPSDNPSARGTLVAVKKLPATKFPLAFEMTGADMPFQQGPFEGDMVLTARIDQDGDPLSHQKGDVFGSLPKVRVGSKNVRLTLDQLQKEDESLAGGGPGPGPGPMMGGGRPGMMPPGHPGLPPGHP